MTHSEIASEQDPELQGLRRRAEMMLEEARRLGADQAEVAIRHDDGFRVSVRMGEVDTLQFNRDRGFSITVYCQHRKGMASSTDDSAHSLRETVAAAMAIARNTSADEHNGIAPPELLARNVPELDLCHPWELSPEEAIGLARECENAGRQDARIVNSDGAGLSTSTSLVVYGNSNGFLGAYRTGMHSRSCVLVAEQDGRMQRDYWYDARRNPRELESAEAVGTRAARRTLARLGAQRPETGTVPVLFEPRVATGLLGHLAGAFSGGALYRKASFLHERLGERILPEWASLGERPLLPGMNGSAPFDSDGLPTRDQDFVREGVLQQYALDLYSARRLGMTPTGNGGGVHNLALTTGDEDQAGLLARMERGILVTEVMGQGVNLVTGDYSRGAAGFLVENGEIAAPVEEFTIAGNLLDMFAGLQGSGTDVDTRGRIHSGSLLLAEMRVAGT